MGQAQAGTSTLALSGQLWQSRLAQAPRVALVWREGRPRTGQSKHRSGSPGLRHRGRGSKHSQVQTAVGSPMLLPGPFPWRGCLFQEALLDSCQAVFPSLTLLSGQGASRAGPPLAWCPQTTAGPGPSRTARPRRSAQGLSLRPPCPKRVARGPHDRPGSTPERPAGASHAETLKTAMAPQGRRGASGQRRQWSALESAARFKIPNPEQFGKSWLESHLQEGPEFKLGAPGPWDLPLTPWHRQSQRGTQVGCTERREGRGNGMPAARGPDIGKDRAGRRYGSWKDQGAGGDGPDLGQDTQDAWLKSWTCLVNAALCLRMAQGTQNHVPTHVT